MNLVANSFLGYATAQDATDSSSPSIELEGIRGFPLAGGKDDESL